MSETDRGSSPIRARGEQHSIVESFGIRGLYGYRSIALSSEYAATVLIAKNGTGKTTLLGALDAFLRLQFSRLRGLDFEEMHCRLRGVERELTLTHEDVNGYLELPSEGELIRAAARSGVEPQLLLNFVLDEWPTAKEDPRSSAENKVYSSLLQAFDYKYAEVESTINRIWESKLDTQPRLAAIAQTVRERLAGFDIVYLPTYRRIELSLRGDAREDAYRRRRRRPRFNVADGSLFSGDIQFGLSDVSDRLTELNQRIIIDSNNGYGKISANIINELIDGSFETSREIGRDIPSKDELGLFFSRLQESTDVRRFYPPVTIPDLDQMYSQIYREDGVVEESSKFLQYFLSKLGEVVKATREVTVPVEEFVRKCNNYLLSDEPSTDINSLIQPHQERQIDAKRLRLNPRNLSVHVESLLAQRKISLDALSSGEKQMVSLFAKLFLYPGEKIVLVDEPELSLSIDWQKKILVDVLSAPLCRQVIAITHSPFVFDNELEPFARSLQLSVSTPPRTDIHLQAVEDEEDVDD